MNVKNATLQKFEGIAEQRQTRYHLYINTSVKWYAQDVTRRGQKVFKPNAIVTYNNNMVAIDRQDQMLACLLPLSETRLDSSTFFFPNHTNYDDES